MPATARKSKIPFFAAVWSCDEIHTDPGIVFAGYESSMRAARQNAAQHNLKYHPQLLIRGVGKIDAKPPEKASRP
ncbi:MAG: hypothetical protein ACYDGM_11600 [Vulcanimicrobiaceae bacterium]